jgi:hypothetical protein
MCFMLAMFHQIALLLDKFTHQLSKNKLSEIPAFEVLFMKIVPWLKCSRTDVAHSSERVLTQSQTCPART